MLVRNIDIKENEYKCESLEELIIDISLPRVVYIYLPECGKYKHMDVHIKNLESPIFLLSHNGSQVAEIRERKKMFLIKGNGNFVEL